MTCRGACARSTVSHPCAILHPQVESALAVQKLKPTIDAIKRQYGEDKNSIQRETSALYEASGVNPAAGEPHTAASSMCCTEMCAVLGPSALFPVVEWYLEM